MKKHKLHIQFAWAILTCFLAGQYIAYSHQHAANLTTLTRQETKKSQPAQTIKEKCNVCDMMHHTAMVLFASTLPLLPVSNCSTPYTRQHQYAGIALILSAGRSPPLV